MVNYIIFDDEITLYWDKLWVLDENPIYKIFIDGREIGNTQNTHYSIYGLSQRTAYKIKINCIVDGKETILFDTELTTLVQKRKIDITKSPYNAVGDGVTLNTYVLQKAVDDCGENEYVYIPEGVFLTGALNLHSNMEIYIEKNGILQGTSEIIDYSPKIKSRFEGIEMMCYRSLINMGELDKNSGYNCENVVIRGGGIIYGGGRKLAENIIEFEKQNLKDFLEENKDYVATCESIDTMPARSRGRLINMSNCKNIVISNVELGYGPAWNVHMIYSSDILTYGCSFKSKKIWNGDGWDPDSSKNCTLFGCEFFTGDDAVAIKSGKNPEGNVINRPCEHIKIFDCISHLGHGITIGSEMSGGVNDVQIWNCDLKRSLYGVQIKATKKRGGYVKNIHISHCAVSRLLMQSVPYNDDGVPAPTPPVFEDCFFHDLNITGILFERDGSNAYCNPIEISGFNIPGSYIKNIKLKNITIVNNENCDKDGIILKYCDGVTLENIRCK